MIVLYCCLALTIIIVVAVVLSVVFHQIAREEQAAEIFRAAGLKRVDGKWVKSDDQDFKRVTDRPLSS
jgi:hypothetical protein